MSEMIVLRGCPGSGKSTWASTRAWDKYTFLASRDALRLSLFGRPAPLSHDQENQVTKAQMDLVVANLKAGNDVIIDNQNLRDKECRDWRDVADAFVPRLEGPPMRRSLRRVLNPKHDVTGQCPAIEF